MEQRGLEVESFLKQVVNVQQEPDLKKGKVEAVSGAAYASVTMTDFVILIGGEGGTWELRRHALRAGRPVIPLPYSEGDALRAMKLLRLVPGMADLQLPRIELNSHDEAVGRSFAAFQHDRVHVPEFGSRAGPFVVDLIVEILPLGDRFLSDRTMEEFLRTAGEIREKLRRWGPMPAEAMESLLTDSEQAWRLIGYIAFQLQPDAQVANLMQALPHELDAIRTRDKTRVFYQWLAAVRVAISEPLKMRYLFTLGPALRRALSMLESKTDSDRGGECKRLLREIIEAVAASGGCLKRK